MYIRGYNIDKGVVLRGADLKFLNLTGLNLADADFTGSDFTRACLRGADLTRAVLDDCNFTGADLSWSVMDINTCHRSRFINANLVGAKARNGNFPESSFAGADLTSASFNASNLFHCDFTRANLSSTSFRGSDLGGAIFVDSIVHNTDVAGANLHEIYAPGFRFARNPNPTTGQAEIQDNRPVMPRRGNSGYQYAHLPHGVFPPQFGPNGANRR